MFEQIGTSPGICNLELFVLVRIPMMDFPIKWTLDLYFHLPLTLPLIANFRETFEISHYDAILDPDVSTLSPVSSDLHHIIISYLNLMNLRFCNFTSVNCNGNRFVF